ncbi:peptidase M50 [Rippkaea orientalis PCC 8801]|uniref:Zinc metalloprotease n=1 Tax=Rippkaea orientalis (strain PCC 8801 / RF-1) TaxID=41431 RepID=B7K4P9_RIPO1|nr:site-2 protease family protein [Rippkaea orientalis]ACK65514.1 peptidase M50 [Rippkaea orientalis PCC 8801]
MQGKWQIGSLLGIPLYLDPSWFIILLFVTLVNAAEISTQRLGGNLPGLGWLAGFIMALLLFGSVLLHELGHSLAARAQGIKVNSITLFLFGGVASIDRESKTPVGAFWVAIAGPLVSFGLFILFFSLIQWVNISSFVPSVTQELGNIKSLLRYMLGDLARINLVLGIFNLIPGLPLDGGQILKAIVWKLTGDRFTGVRWAAASGKLIGWVGISTGLFFVLTTGGLSPVWIALIGWFVLRNADTYDRLTALQESLLKIVAAEAMSHDFRVINAHLTLNQFAQEYILRDLNTSLVYYAASEGRYRGLIRVQDLQLIERYLWENQTLIDIVHPLTEIPSVIEKTPLAEVIETLESISDRSVTVLSPAGAVAGVIDRADIVKIIAIRHNLPIPDNEIHRIKAEGTYPPYLQLPAIAKSLHD